MKLNQYEAETALWKKIEQEMTARLDVLRQRNDGQLDHLETARLRGSIAMVKEVLSWPAQPTENEIRDL